MNADEKVNIDFEQNEKKKQIQKDAQDENMEDVEDAIDGKDEKHGSDDEKDEKEEREETNGNIEAEELSVDNWLPIRVEWKEWTLDPKHSIAKHAEISPNEGADEKIAHPIIKKLLSL